MLLVCPTNELINSNLFYYIRIIQITLTIQFKAAFYQAMQIL